MLCARVSWRVRLARGTVYARFRGAGSCAGSWAGFRIKGVAYVDGGFEDRDRYYGLGARRCGGKAWAH